MKYEIIAWQPSPIEWEARVVDGVSRSWIALGHGATEAEARAEAVRVYECALRVEHAPPVGELVRVQGERRRAKRAPRRLEDIATTANRLASKANRATPRKNPGRIRKGVAPSEAWWADVEHMWRVGTRAEQRRVAARGARLARRAARGSRVTELDVRQHADLALVEGEPAPTELRARWSRSARWARDRSMAMAMARRDVLDACGQRYRTVKCGCGSRELPVGCRQVALCEWCSKIYWKRWQKKIHEALDLHRMGSEKYWRQRGGRGMRPGVYLITFTVPHDGGVEAQRQAIAKAWRGLTKVNQRMSSKGQGWWDAYAAVYEVTPGSDRQGHVHLHVACISSWIPYAELHEQWRRLAPGAQVLDVQSPRADRSPRTAANYLAKYVTKGVEAAEFSGELAGAVMVSNRGRRKVTTSVAFWQLAPDPCRTCGKWHYQVSMPRGLARVVPAGVLRARAEVAGVWLARGEPQTEMW